MYGSFKENERIETFFSEPNNYVMPNSIRHLTNHCHPEFISSFHHSRRPEFISSSYQPPSCRTRFGISPIIVTANLFRRFITPVVPNLFRHLTNSCHAELDSASHQSLSPRIYFVISQTPVMPNLIRHLTNYFLQDHLLF